MGPTLDNSIDSDTPHFLLSSDLEIQGQLPSGLLLYSVMHTRTHARTHAHTHVRTFWQQL